MIASAASEDSTSSPLLTNVPDVAEHTMSTCLDPDMCFASVFPPIDSVARSPLMIRVSSLGGQGFPDATIARDVLLRSTTDWIFSSAYSTVCLSAFCLTSKTA